MMMNVYVITTRAGVGTRHLGISLAELESCFIVGVSKYITLD